jgi:P4 family phage/plasmid primase-like protien
LTHPTCADASYRAQLLPFYAAQGLRLHPCWWIDEHGRCACPQPDCREQNWGKHPVLGAWQHAASADVATLLAWHERWPLANWAWALDEDCYVLDCDPRNGGPRTETWLSDLRALGLPEPPPTLFQVSGSGGLHAAYRVSGYEPKGNDTLVLPDGSTVPGVNVKGAGGYVLVAPSNHRSGGLYRWLDPWRAPVPWPELDTFLSRSPARARGGNGGGAGSLVDPAPGEAFLEKWYREAPGVVSGGQRSWLLSGLGWMRKRGRSDVEMMALGWGVAQRFVTYDPAEPWSEVHVADLVRDVGERYEATRDGDQVIPAWRPAVVTGGAGPEGNGAAAVVDLAAERERRGVQVGEEVPNRPSDVANAEELVATYRDQLLWSPGLGWHVWTGTHWELDDLQRRHRLVAVLADTLRRRQADVEGDERADLRRRWVRLESVSGMEACLRAAESLLARRAADLDQRPELLPVANGTLDLRTGELRPGHDPADLLTRCVPTAYHEGATSPLLDEYRATFLPDPERWEVLLRVLGAALVGGNPWRNLVLLVGPTTTGKSQLAAALEACLGPYVGVGGASVFRGHLDDRPRTDLLKLLTCRVALMEEAGHAWQLHADRVKAVTGGATISVRGMHSGVYVDRVPAFTPVIVANELPRVKGADTAVLQRLVVVEFNRRPEREEVSKRAAFLADPAVREALLAELVAGCRRAQRSGASADDLPHVFQLERAAAFEALDDLSETLGAMEEVAWLAHDPALPGSESVKTLELHGAYVRFLAKHGDSEQVRERLGPKQFGQRLAVLGPRWVRDRNHGGTRWVGWRVTDPASWRP